MKNLFENAALVFDDYKKEFYENIIKELKNDYEIPSKSNYENISGDHNWHFMISINEIQLHIFLHKHYYIHYYTETIEKDKLVPKLEKEFGELKSIKSEDFWYASKKFKIDFFDENKSCKEITDEIRKIAQKIEEVIK